MDKTSLTDAINKIGGNRYLAVIKGEIKSQEMFAWGRMFMWLGVSDASMKIVVSCLEKHGAVVEALDPEIKEKFRKKIEQYNKNRLFPCTRIAIPVALQTNSQLQEPLPPPFAPSAPPAGSEVDKTLLKSTEHNLREKAGCPPLQETIISPERREELFKKYGYFIRKSGRRQMYYVLEYKEITKVSNRYFTIDKEGVIYSEGHKFKSFQKMIELYVPPSEEQKKLLREQVGCPPPIQKTKISFKEMEKLFQESGHFVREINHANVYTLYFKNERKSEGKYFTIHGNGTIEGGGKIFTSFNKMVEFYTSPSEEKKRPPEQVDRPKLLTKQQKHKEFFKEPKIIYAADEVPASARTKDMKHFCECFAEYDKNAIELTIESQKYIPITAAMIGISQKRIASCGSSRSREVLTLDPQNAPLLNNHLEQLKDMFRQNPHFVDEARIIAAVINYVREGIFPSCNDPKLVEKFGTFITKQWCQPCSLTYRDEEGQHRIPVISIDTFIKAQLGVSRHHALVTAYLLNALASMNPPILRGTVQHMRENLDQGGADVWVTFMSLDTGKRWHVNSFCDELRDFCDENEKKILEDNYGVNAIANQVKKTDPAYFFYQRQAVGCPEPLLSACVNAESRKKCFETDGYLVRKSEQCPGKYVLECPGRKHYFSIEGQQLFLEEGHETKKRRFSSFPELLATFGLAKVQPDATK